MANPLAEVIDAVEAKRGSRWAFPDLHAPSTAVIGCEVTRLGLTMCSRLRGAIPRIDWLARTARAAGGTVVWCHFGPDAFDGPAGDVLGTEARGQMRARLTDRAWTDVVDGVQGTGVDRKVPCNGYTAFTREGSHLPYILRDMGIDTVVVCGAETEGAVSSNARDACTAGFRVIVASDCCASADEAAHWTELAAIHRRFGDVHAADEIIAELRRGIGTEG